MVTYQCIQISSVSKKRKWEKLSEVNWDKQVAANTENSQRRQDYKYKITEHSNTPQKGYGNDELIQKYKGKK